MEQKVFPVNRWQIRSAHKIRRFLTQHPFKGSARLIALFNKLLIPVPQEGPILAPTNYGFDIIVDPVKDKVLEGAIYYYGTYEAGTLEVLQKSLQAGHVFFDVGSNIGFMSLFASRLIGKSGSVYSFEPEPETFAILKENVRLNKLNNIYLFDMALGSEKKEVFIYRDLKTDRGKASLIRPEQGDVRPSRVPLRTLDDFIAQNRISRIDMIKIDVEGWEMEVLRGAKKILGHPQAPMVCIEYSHRHPVYSAEPLDIYRYILSLNGYRIYKLQEGKERISRLEEIHEVTQLPVHDNLFCFLPKHLGILPKDLFA
ncbi:MAG: hypothetical protein AMJ95_13285 [Omnitrophica WOR_2 bacterium SM23_72]|nr:MAG: hypothetical protein AMJ95_13285 [Omnitrophica WOR_2 bacterium SM23_72]